MQGALWQKPLADQRSIPTDLTLVPGRSCDVVADWLDERYPDWLANIPVAALDPGASRIGRSPTEAARSSGPRLDLRPIPRRGPTYGPLRLGQ